MGTRASVRLICSPCCDNAGGGSTPTIDGTGYCTSRTGSGNLRGWSKAQNQNAGDWNYRKYTALSYVPWINPLPHLYMYSGTGASCTGTGLGAWSWDEVLSAAASWDVSGNTQVGNVTYRVQNACSTLGGGSTNLSPPTGALPMDGAFSVSTTAPADNIRKHTYTRGSFCVDFTTVCTVCPNTVPASCTAAPSSDIHEVSATITLSVPDSVAAALARGTSTTGSLCKTSAGMIGSTSVVATGQIAISGVTSVTRTEPLSGLTVGKTYDIDIILNRYTAGGGSFVDQVTYETVTFVASATSENFTYEVPVDTTYDYEWDHAANLVLVP